MRLAALTVAALLFAGQAWAKTWVVPGTDTFAAALAAMAGDVVLLSAGSYGSLAPTGTGNAGSAGTGGVGGGVGGTGGSGD